MSIESVSQRIIISVIAIIVLASICISMNTSELCAAEVTRVPCDKCNEPNRFVRLQSSQIEKRSRPFAHPLHIRPESWAVILKSIQLRSRTEGFPFFMTTKPAVEAFSDAEIEYLSFTLTEAFAEARPDEWIVFGLSNQRTQHLIEMTTGGCFIDGDSLHLVLANYKEAVTLPNIRTLLWEEPLHSQSGYLYNFVPGSHQMLVQNERKRILPIVSQLPEISIAYKALLREESVKESETKTAISPDHSSQSFSQSTHDVLSIEERLRRLQHLKEQDLITEEEYRVKKKQILEGL